MRPKERKESGMPSLVQFDHQSAWGHWYNGYTMTGTIARIVAHLLLFAFAGVVFFFGLGVGLAFNPALGTLLWAAAAGIVGLNLLWILRSRR